MRQKRAGAVAFCFLWFVFLSFPHKVYSNGKFHEKAVQEEQEKQKAINNAAPPGTPPAPANENGSPAPGSSVTIQQGSIPPQAALLTPEEEKKAAVKKNMKLFAFLAALTLILLLANYTYTRGTIDQSSKKK